LWIAVALLATFVTFLMTMRILRHRSSPPEQLGRVQRARNLFTDIYGARTAAGVILFDAGVDPEGGALDRLLGALSATRTDVSDVFLSHGHFDHVSSAPLCTQAKIRVGAPDVEFMAQRAPIIAPLAGRLLSRVFPAPPVFATDPLSGKSEITVGKERVLAIPTPGHTPGSYVFVFDGVMFAGDTMTIDNDKLDFCMGPFSIDRDANRRSVAQLGEALGGVEVHTVCTGHMGCTPPGQGKAMLAALIERAKQ
jgi:glyoxylase-like metal-dependent hydrolase (beta-lactamase superfamily II)